LIILTEHGENKMLSNGGKIYRREITPEMYELTDTEEKMQEGVRSSVCGNLELKKYYFPLITAMCTSAPDYYWKCLLTENICVGGSPSFGERFMDGLLDGFRELHSKESPLVHGLSKKIIGRCPSREFK